MTAASRRPDQIEESSGTIHPLTGYDTSRWLGGWRQAMNSAGIPEDADLAVACPATFEGRVSSVDRLLALSQPPTAVVAAQDLVAIGAHSAARRHGLRVPDDFSVVGFDNAYADLWPDPPLTSVGAGFGRTRRPRPGRWSGGHRPRSRLSAMGAGQLGRRCRA